MTPVGTTLLIRAFRVQLQLKGYVQSQSLFLAFVASKIQNILASKTFEKFVEWTPACWLHCNMQNTGGLLLMFSGIESRIWESLFLLKDASAVGSEPGKRALGGTEWRVSTRSCVPQEKRIDVLNILRVRAFYIDDDWLTSLLSTTHWTTRVIENNCA